MRWQIGKLARMIHNTTGSSRRRPDHPGLISGPAASAPSARLFELFRLDPECICLGDCGNIIYCDTRLSLVRTLSSFDVAACRRGKRQKHTYPKKENTVSSAHHYPAFLLPATDRLHPIYTCAESAHETVKEAHLPVSPSVGSYRVDD